MILDYDTWSDRQQCWGSREEVARMVRLVVEAERGRERGDKKKVSVSYGSEKWGFILERVLGLVVVVEEGVSGWCKWMLAGSECEWVKKWKSRGKEATCIFQQQEEVEGNESGVKSPSSLAGVGFMRCLCVCVCVRQSLDGGRQGKK